MVPPLERREFLVRTAWAAGGLLAAPRLTLGGPTGRDGLSRVVHVHHGRAATWSRAAGTLYRDFVDQETVNLMLDEAVRHLKGGSTESAWRAVFPLANPETRTLGIKVNCNNALDPVDGAGNEIDAIPEPVIAVIRGFVTAGGRSANCHVYDGTNTSPQRHIATWFRDRVRAVFPDVQFHGGTGYGDYGDGRDCDPRECVTWDPAYQDPPPETRIYGLALEWDYLVNVPIVKRHSQANITLGYKNHFGTVDRCDRLHPWVYEDVPEASVLADILGSPTVPGDPSVKSLAEKTALVVGDMLYGQPCSNFGKEPRPWEIFRGEWPNSLVVSDDPVAADSVMADILQQEPAYDGGCGSIRSWARRYLEYAEAKGQGTYDHVDLPAGQLFDPALMTYTKIDYRHLEMWPSGADLRVSRLENGAVLLEWTHYFEGDLCEIWRATRPDFSDAELLGASPTGQYIDGNPPEPAFYRIYRSPDS